MRKVLIPLILILVASGIVGGWFKFSSKNVPKGNPTLSQNLPSENLKEYQSEAGFVFSYPEELTVTNKVSDSATYADISLTSPKVTGQITLKISDTKLKSLEDWSKGKEITLAGIPAWEMSQDGGLSTAALDQGILFIIKVSPENEKDFWLSAYETLVSTFAFSSSGVNGPSNVESSGDTGQEVIFEGEETIE